MYFMRTIPNIKSQLKQLDDAIRTEFLPAITGGINYSDIEKRLMPLPPRFGVLEIPIFSESGQREYEFSTILSKDSTTNIINQQRQLAANNNAKKIKSKKKKKKLTKIQYHNEQLQKLQSTLSEEQKRVNELNGEQGTSSWLTTIPLSEEGYRLTKQLFWDLIRISYGWTLTRPPSNCEFGIKFDIQHALSCKKGDFVSLDTTTSKVFLFIWLFFP